SLIWLIVVAFMIARGFIKTGLGRRIALQMIRLLGKRTLGLAYGLAFADLILSPAMPSNTARCGGVIYPIADSLARSFHSNPEDESRSKIGTFLITCIGNVNDVTAALFMTGYTGNLLAVKLAANAGVTLTWGGWFMAALLPCLVSLLLVPL
ncbi:anion permease, partial [Escherichia coli]